MEKLFLESWQRTASTSPAHWKPPLIAEPSRELRYQRLREYLRATMCLFSLVVQFVDWMCTAGGYAEWSLNTELSIPKKWSWLAAHGLVCSADLSGFDCHN